MSWGWYYLSTVLEDYSRYILAWTLRTSMGATDVMETLDLARRRGQAGGDIYVLSKLLGHSSVSITERHYAHVVDADIIARARQIRLPSPEGAAEGATQSATPARRRRAS